MKNNGNCTREIPKIDLSCNSLYGLKLDPEQRRFKDLIFNESVSIIFSNSKSGTGKTTIAVAAAVLMYRAGLIDHIEYVVHSVGDRQGSLPGTLADKNFYLLGPLYSALWKAHEVPEKVIKSEDMNSQKEYSPFITATSDTYLRGYNIGDDTKTLLILDEAQNFPEASLRMMLTRACNTTKVIVIGHEGQIDLPDPKRSGFVPCMRHYESKKDPRVSLCNLTTNHRGFVSSVADEPWVE